MTCNPLNFSMARRDFFGRFALGLGGVALAQLTYSPMHRLTLRRGQLTA
jgi:hypothetical protein